MQGHSLHAVYACGVVADTEGPCIGFRSITFTSDYRLEPHHCASLHGNSIWLLSATKRLYGVDSSQTLEWAEQQFEMSR